MIYIILSDKIPIARSITINLNVPSIKGEITRQNKTRMINIMLAIFELKDGTPPI